MALLSFLIGRELGADNPLLLLRAETTRRAYSLDVSRHYDVQSVHPAGVNTLDIDPVETR